MRRNYAQVFSIKSIATNSTRLIYFWCSVDFCSFRDGITNIFISYFLLTFLENR